MTIAAEYTNGSNYSVLTQNTLIGLGEGAQHLYLKLLDVFAGHSNRENERKAFYAALDYEQKVGATIDHILLFAPLDRMNDKTRSELSKFFAERWRHNFIKAKP